jgi:hypothetical protein
MAALAAGVAQVPVAELAPQMRTKVLPGHGYIRYEVEPGDEEAPPGELIVVHEERRLAPLPDAAGSFEEPARRPAGRDDRACSAARAKLVARIFEMQGVQIEPEFAEWLEKNLTIGSPEVPTLQLLRGDSLLLTAMKADGIARGLAEDLARCERAHSR